MEIIQKLVLETLEKDSLIPDTRALGSEFSQQQVIGVLMRLESHQVRYVFSISIVFLIPPSSSSFLDGRIQG